jgi:hypothetical protein
VWLRVQNVANKTNLGNPTGNLQSGDFMRIFTLYNAYAEPQVRLAVRAASAARPAPLCGGATDSSTAA